MKEYIIHPDLFGLIANGAASDEVHFNIKPHPMRGFHIEHVIKKKIKSENFRVKVDMNEKEKT